MKIGLALTLMHGVFFFLSKCMVC